MFDGIIDTFFGSAASPLEMAVCFLVLCLTFDSLFGLINNLVNASRK